LKINETLLTLSSWEGGDSFLERGALREKRSGKKSSFYICTFVHILNLKKFPVNRVERN